MNTTTIFNDPTATSEKCDRVITLLLENCRLIQAEIRTLEKTLDLTAKDRIEELSKTLLAHALLGLQLCQFKRELQLKEMAMQN